MNAGRLTDCCKSCAKRLRMSRDIEYEDCPTSDKVKCLWVQGHNDCILRSSKILAGRTSFTSGCCSNCSTDGRLVGVEIGWFEENE